MQPRVPGERPSGNARHRSAPPASISALRRRPAPSVQTGPLVSSITTSPPRGPVAAVGVVDGECGIPDLGVSRVGDSGHVVGDRVGGIGGSVVVVVAGGWLPGLVGVSIAAWI